MASVNRVILVGNLGADPEVRTFQNGGKIANVSIATTDRWTDKNTGEQREATEWHRVVFSDRLADIVAQYLRKGSSVYVEGSIKTRKWQDQNGQDRYATEIRATSMQMLGSRTDGGQGQQTQNGYQQGYGNAPQGQQYAPQQGNGGQWGSPPPHYQPGQAPSFPPPQNGFTGGIPNEFQPPHHQTGQPPAFPPQNGGQNMGKW